MNYPKNTTQTDVQLARKRRYSLAQVWTLVNKRWDLPNSIASIVRTWQAGKASQEIEDNKVKQMLYILSYTVQQPTLNNWDEHAESSAGTLGK